MTTLAANLKRIIEIGDYQDLPVIASDIIFEGAAVGDNGSGFARPLVAGDPFKGFADAKADNSAGAAGAISVTVLTKGLIRLPISGAAITDVDKPVYASDDNAFTLTQSTNSHIGRVVRFVSTGIVIVAFDATRAGLGGLIAELSAITGGESPTEAEHNLVVAAVNSILRMLGN